MLQLQRPKTQGIATIVGLALMVTLVGAPVIASAQGRDSEGETRRVVILNGTDPYLPAFLELDGGMRDAVRAWRSERTEFYAETLDMHRFPQALLVHNVVALLRQKYRGLKVDVVVPAAPIALDFVERYREEIWPDAVIVFNSMPTTLLREKSLKPRTIGVPVKLEFGPTLDLALKLRPATRHIVVVSGAADADQRHLSLARASLERYAGGRDVEYIVGLTLAKTVAVVRALPADAVVLYLTMFRDGAGAPQVPREVLTRLAEVSRAPIFGVFDTYLGHGIVAGSIAGFGAQGRRVGELVARVLNGEDPAAIGVQAPVAPSCMADWHQLRRWGISETLLPADCEVRFREITVWDRYRWQILVTLAVILAQAILIVALMMNRRRLRHAQIARGEEYGRRTQAEAKASRLQERLARFSRERSLGTMATTIAHEINQPLIAIQNYAQAARRRLQSDADDKPRLMELFAKIEGQAERAGAITQHVRTLVSKGEPELHRLSLYPLLQDVIRMMEPECETRNCRIVCTAPDDLPLILADVLQVQLVLVNLLNNALRGIGQTKKSAGLIAIDVRRIDDREVQVSVTDGGPGVPPEQVGDIFEPHFSGGGTGMGMGLAICRDIISAHGGRIWYEPNPPGGAIFRFTLRIASS